MNARRSDPPLSPPSKRSARDRAADGDFCLPDSSARPYPVPLRQAARSGQDQALRPERETIGSLRRRMARALTEAFAARGYDGTPALDARLLIAHVTGLAPQAVPLNDEAPVDGERTARALAFAERRAAGEPVARIVGHKEFHGHDFLLSADTLVPRPDTETLVDAALAMIAPDGDMRVVDIGTGSGAILLSVLAERPSATGIGIDIAPGAVRTARENADRMGLGERALFVVGDWLGPVGRADVILANPPYIEVETISRLAADVREHDPIRALSGGADGLEAIRVILAEVGRVMGRNGALLMEIGAGQAPDVAKIAETHGMTARFVRDIAGIDRVAIVAAG